MSTLLSLGRVYKLVNTASTLRPIACLSRHERSRNATSNAKVGVNRLPTTNSHRCQGAVRGCSNKFHKYQPVMDAPEGTFRGSADRFQGITVDSAEESGECPDFEQKLTKSLEHWKESKRRAIWFKVHTQQSDWIPALTRNSFDFHHASKGYVVLSRWLPEDEYENLPVYAHTMVGVGGLVVNDRNEVLVVSERHALIPNSWKLPGGYVEPRENFIDGVIREVREETGVEAEFNTVISLRHSHGGGYGCSDLYIVVALRAKSTSLTRCEREIAKVAWMPIEEYLNHPNVHETNRHFVRTLLDYESRGLRFTCEKAKHQVLKKEYCMYYVKALEQQDAAAVADK